MRRSSLTMLLSAFALVACSSGGGSAEPGSANGADGGASSNGNGNAPQSDGGLPMVNGGGGSHDAGADAADAGPQVTTDGCIITASPADDACVLRDDLGVFVSASKGSDASGDGTMAQPFATAAHGITFAKAHQKRVFLCAETYAENITIENGVSMFGGLDCTQPKWTVTAARAHFAAPASPAARADNVTTTTAIEAVEIFAPDATVPSGSSIGMIANASPALLLRNVWLQAGNAMSGVAGVEAASNDEGPITTGTPIGGEGPCAGIDCVNGYAANSGGGISACGGGMGGSGGSRGYFAGTQCANAPCFAVNPSGFYWLAVKAAGTGVKSAANAGSAGASGLSGASGVIGAAGYAPGDGVAGSNGTPGMGGSGGDGAAPAATASSSGDRFGRWGSAGGAGGCAGHAGTAGTGGGASIALIALQSAITVKASKLTSMTGGDGGMGTVGAAATAGGAGGACDVTVPTTCGAHGGAGGEAGVSGSGAAGPSLAIAYRGALPVIDALTTLVPGTGGAGVDQQIQGGKVLTASGAGASQAIYSF